MCFIGKGVLKNFTKFTRKHLRQGLNIKESLPEVFSCGFCEIFKKAFLREMSLGDCFYKLPNIKDCFFSEMFNKLKSLTIVPKSSILDVWQVLNTRLTCETHTYGKQQLKFSTTKFLHSSVFLHIFSEEVNACTSIKMR